MSYDTPYTPTVMDTVFEEDEEYVMSIRPPTLMQTLFKNIRRLSPLAQAVFVIFVFITCGFVLHDRNEKHTTEHSCPQCVPCEDQSPELKQKIAYLFHCGVMNVIESTLTQYCVSKKSTEKFEVHTFFNNGLLRIDAL